MCLLDKYVTCSSQITLTLICMVYVLWFGFYYSWKLAPPTDLSSDTWRKIIEDNYVCWYTVVQFSSTVPALIGVYMKRPNFLIPLLASDLCRILAIAISMIYILASQLPITDYEGTLLLFSISLGIQFYIIRIEVDAYYELKKYRMHSGAIAADYNPVVFVVDVPDEKTYSKNTSKTIPIRTVGSAKSHVSNSDVEYLPESYLPPSNYHEYTSLYIFEKNFYTAPWSIHSELRIQ